MTRRRLLGILASLPFVGVWFQSTTPEAAPRTRAIYARAGEKVTCENGHEICEVLRTLRVGDMQDIKQDFGNWRQREPQAGEIPIPPCETCDAAFVAGGMIYHIEGEWRDPYGLLDRPSEA